MPNQRRPSGDPLGRRIVELACRAPSIHNTQPWSWRIRRERLDLYADFARQLPLTDPEGRLLVLSCGAALDHARVAAAGLGYETRVERLPDGPNRTRLASIELVPAPVTPRATDRLEALERRCTDRRRFTTWPVPDERLKAMARSLDSRDVAATALTDIRLRLRAERLVDSAMRQQAADPRYLAEQEQWIGERAGAGIPLSVLTPATAGRAGPRSRFVEAEPAGPAGNGGTDAGTDAGINTGLRSSDGLIALMTTRDEARAWLYCGEALSRLWLTATAEGLSVVPLSQVVELVETRRALWNLLGHPPQLLLRIGWQEIGRSQLPRTPRRALDRVLRA